jgi:predicted RecA/RadA family phage recombinase
MACASFVAPHTCIIDANVTLTVAAPYTVKSGGGVKVGNLFGVAVYDAALNASLEIVAMGVFDLAKDTSTFASGDAVYWDDTNKVATSTATGNKKIGVAVLSQPSGVNAPGGNISVAGGAGATFYDDVTQNGTMVVSTILSLMKRPRSRVRPRS